jgi:hypothetical protein
MKFLLPLFLLFSLSLPTSAQDKAELTPLQKLNVANGLTAVIVGPVAFPAAMLSGQKEGLCNVLGGTYTPNSDGKDQCPGGVWLRIIPYLAERKQ